MHPAAAAAHAFEYNSLYIMDAGHIAVEIDTTGQEQIAAFNREVTRERRAAIEPQRRREDPTGEPS